MSGAERRRKPPAVENPPEGKRLVLGSLAADFRISMTDMAEAARISRTAMFNLATSNQWPVRTDPEPIREGLVELFMSRGATAEQAATLFHAHTRVKYHAAAQPPEKKEEVTDVLLPKQTLTPAARKAFELFVNPFDGEVESAEQMYTNGEIRFVREACWQAAINARFVGVVGESGAGKTTLLADLKERIQTDRKPTIVIEPSVLGMEASDSSGKTLKAADILAALVCTLTPLAVVAQTMERRSRQAERALTDSTTAGNSHLLLIEEAHALPIATLRHLKRLHERMRLNGRRPMLGILLLGQPELRMRLHDNSHSVREVVQRLELVELQPLTHDLKGYLQHRAKLAGRDLETLIDVGGIEAIRERLTVLPSGVRNAPVSLHYPLAVNNMVTACLNAAAAIGAPIVTRDVVRSL